MTPDLTGEESVWDLYCGIGTISLFLSQKAKQVYGVEIVPQAIEDAKNNAKLNGITNAQFFVGKAEEVLPEFYEQKESVVRKKLVSESESAGDEDASMRHSDVIVVDPPRKGCDDDDGGKDAGTAGNVLQCAHIADHEVVADAHDQSDHSTCVPVDLLQLLLAVGFLCQIFQRGNCHSEQLHNNGGVDIGCHT